MNVTFVSFGEDIASSRLRAKIPQNELAKLGIKKGTDVVIYGKHILSFEQLKPFKKKIYDITDDHFGNELLRKYYIDHCAAADLITCSSEVMRKRIKEETGRDATVIREPYESEEKSPAIGDMLLWFGHASNMVDLERVAPSLTHPLLILSNYPGYPEWSPASFDKAISVPCIVIIPTGKSQAKSENRMVESIRRGRFVCAEFLHSYEPFERFFPLGDIPKNIESALANPEESIQRIKDAQDYIRDRYSPRTIAEQWLEVIYTCR